jgi:hypothetical protein
MVQVQKRHQDNTEMSPIFIGIGLAIIFVLLLALIVAFAKIRKHDKMLEQHAEFHALKDEPDRKLDEALYPIRK